MTTQADIRPDSFLPKPLDIIERGDGREYRDEILQLCERVGRPDFCRHFDWYFRDQGQEAPTTYLLRDKSGQLCGIASVTVRQLRLGNIPIRAGVAGNLLVDRGSGMFYGASSLARAMKSLVSEGQIDILLGIPNREAYPIFVRVGFQEIDRWRTHAALYRSRELLHSRFGATGTVCSLIIDLVAATRRVIAGRSATLISGLQAKELTESELARLPVEAWLPPNGVIVGHPSTEYLKWRYLRHPDHSYSIVAILTPGGEVRGCIVVQRSLRRSWVAECFVDSAHISEANAILCFCRRRRPSDHTIWIPYLRSSALSGELSSRGLIPLSESLGGYPDYPLLGYWRRDHPLSATFSRPYSWNLFPGFNDI